jgi:hypothetical protein
MLARMAKRKSWFRCCIMGLSFHAAVALAVSFWSVSALCGQEKQPEVELYERARQSLAGKKLPDAEAALQDLLKVNPKLGTLCHGERPFSCFALPAWKLSYASRAAFGQ